MNQLELRRSSEMDAIRRNKNYFKLIEFKRKYPKVQRCYGRELLVRLSLNQCNYNNAAVRSEYYFDKRSEPNELNRSGSKRKHHFIVFNFNIKRRGYTVRNEFVSSQSIQFLFFTFLHRCDYLLILSLFYLCKSYVLCVLRNQD